MMEIYAVRLPKEVVKEFEELCKAQFLPPRAVARSWILQRLEAEKNRIPEAGGNLPRTTPAASEHQAPVGADDDGTMC